MKNKKKEEAETVADEWNRVEARTIQPQQQKVLTVHGPIYCLGSDGGASAIRWHCESVSLVGAELRVALVQVVNRDCDRCERCGDAWQVFLFVEDVLQHNLCFGCGSGVRERQGLVPAVNR